MAERGEWADESDLTPHTRQRRNDQPSSGTAERGPQRPYHQPVCVRWSTVRRPTTHGCWIRSCRPITSRTRAWPTYLTARILRVSSSGSDRRRPGWSLQWRTVGGGASVESSV